MEEIKKFNLLKEWLDIKEPNDYVDLILTPSRKIVAKKDINKGEIIFYIPDEKLIDNKYFNQLDNYENYNKELKSKTTLVTLQLLKFMDDEYWKPYIDMLPENLEDFWYYINPNVKELIKNSQLIKEIGKFEERYFNSELKVLEKYHPELKEKENKEKWIRTKLLVHSRVFGYKKNEIDMIGLSPMADMLDHSSEYNCVWNYSNELNSFYMKSNKNIKTGEELLDSYGTNKTSTSYYLMYGFVPYDKILLNDVVININGKKIDINTKIESFLENNNNDIRKVFNILKYKLKSLPTNEKLIKAGASESIILLISNEKLIIEKLVLDLKIFIQNKIKKGT